VTVRDHSDIPGTDNGIRYATLQCPHCGQRSREAMPRDACTYFFVCPWCSALLKPTPGNCCVFCSYGDRVCPPVSDQMTRQERTVSVSLLAGGTAEIRLRYDDLGGWSVELYLNGRFLASQRCASEKEALDVARDMQRSGPR
jgi:hypothetical protein